MEIPNPLPFVVHLDDLDGPCDVIDAIALGGFVAGAHAVARSARSFAVDPWDAIRADKVHEPEPRRHTGLYL